MIEVIYKPTKQYPLGKTTTYSIENNADRNMPTIVYKEDLYFSEISTGVWGLSYYLNNKKVLDSTLLKHEAGHLNEYLEWLNENVFSVKLNGLAVFDSESLEEQGGGSDEDATDGN